MRQILLVVLVIMALSSMVFATDIVRDGDDVVIYKQVEVQRFKNVPKEVPVAEAIKIMQAGKGEYVLPSKVSKRMYHFGFPIVETNITTKKVMTYQDGAWDSHAISGSPVTGIAVLGTYFFIIIPAIFLMFIGFINQKTGGGDTRLVSAYGVIFLLPLWMRFIFILQPGPYLGNSAAIVTIAILLSIFTSVWIMGRSAPWGVWRDATHVLCTFLSLVVVIVGIASMTSPVSVLNIFTDDFIWKYLAFLAGTCLVTYVITKLAKRLFGWQRPVTPIAPSIPTEFD